MNRRTISCFLFLAALAQFPVLSAANGVDIRIEIAGSTPPVVSLFDCATSLRGKSYSHAASQNCLNHLLATGYFEEGHFDTERNHDKAVIVFHMKSPALVVSKLGLQFSDPDKSNLETSLDNATDVLRQGATYTQDGELATSRQISKFFFLQGRRIGVHSQINLDFRTRTATVSYWVVEGPPGPGAGDVTPYSFDQDCKEFVAVVDFQRSDDQVPLGLVQRLMKTHFGSCYDQASVQADAEALRSTGLFGNVEFLVEGTRERRKLILGISGKPLHVRSISVKCYGEPESYCQSIFAELPLKPGAIYSRSADWLARDQLQKALKKPGENLWVFEDINPDGDSALDVAYGVIFERAELSINGKLVPDYDGAPISRAINSR